MIRLKAGMALLVALLLFAGAPVAANAAPLPQSTDDAGQQAGVTCSDGVCQISLDLDTLAGIPKPALQLASGALRVAEKNIRAIPDGTDLEITDRVTLSLPVGEIEMFNADLDIERSDEGAIERFYGTASVPLPTLGILDELQLVAPGKALVAYDSGEALAHLGAPLDSERRYLALHFGSGNELALTDPAFSFTGAEGQNSLLVVVDPVERFVHVVGNVMLVDTAELLLSQDLLGQAAGLTPGLLPLPERMGVRLALLVTDDLADTEIELSTGYAITGGPVAARFGLDAEPIALEGTLSIGNDGLGFEGVARSTLEPDEVFASEGSVTIQVPLLGSEDRASLAVAGNVDVPMFSFSEGGDVTVTMPEVPIDEAVATVRSQISNSSGAVREGVEWVAVSAASRVPDGTGLREGVEWVTVGAADRLGQSGASARQATEGSVEWTMNFVGNAVEFAVENADEGVAAAGNFWCNRLGRCAPEATAAAGE
jgi:hypothetical protein